MTLPSRLDIDRINKVLAERHFLDFVRLMWHAVEPSRDMVDGWVLEAICLHLEAVAHGQITNIIMNVMPGAMKSLLTTVFFPAWVWGPLNRPASRFLTASYSSSLTERDNVRFAQVIHSPLYRKYWGDRFEAGYSRVKLENNKTGWKLATSVGGVGTGERGDFILIDDPNSVKEVDSETVRASTNQWWLEVVPTRKNDSRSATVVIQQRTHEDDVSGVTLAKDMDFEHLMIPMRYDPMRHCATSIGWSDPRLVEGELAWPARFPLAEVSRLERIMGPFATSGQFAQAPSPRGGGIIKSAWIELWTESEFPPFEYLIGSIDTAYTDKQENDFSAMAVLGLYRDVMGNPKIMLVWAWQERLEFNDLVVKAVETCRKCRIDKLIIEAKSAGHPLSQEIRRAFAGRDFGIELYTPQGDKVSRAYAVQWIFEDGMVFAPDKAWADMTIQALAAFPRGVHDDLVDAVVQGVQHLRRNGLALRRDEAAEAADDEMRLPTRAPALYPV